MDKEKIEKYNEQVLNLISNYLNFNERAITKEQVESVKSYGVDEVEAVRLLLLGYLGVENREFENEYFLEMLTLLNEKEFKENPYYKNIKFKKQTLGNWELKNEMYEPYELFVQDDFILKNCKVIPNLGFFNKTFSYPAVFENGRLWMSVTPNEINTMKEPIENANGKVLTFGLGLGYFAYMCSLKERVASVTIIEKDEKVIELFKKFILPKFEHKEKIRIVKNDAYEFLKNMEDGEFDFSFVDIYHDAGDGMECYFNFKPYLANFNKTKFNFWIEKTIKYYTGD